MAKLLKDIVKTKPTKVTNDLGGYSPKAGDEQQFAKKHSIDKYPDRNGNGDDVFNASNIKHSQIDEPRHGYKKPEDIKVHEAHSCNMTKEDVSCPVHGMKECMSESKLKEDWIVTHSDGKVTKHLGQRDAMKASRSSPGSKVSATHGAMGQKASTVLSPHQTSNIGTFSAAGYTPPEKKKKMKEEVEELDEISVVGRSKVSNFVFSKKGKENRAAYIAKQKSQYDPVIKKQKEIKSKNLEMMKAISAKRKAANEEFEIEEGFVVRYNNPKSEKHGSEKHFDDQVAAKKHATRGNVMDKIGGKYTVHKTNEKGHDVKEEIELDEVLSKSEPAGSWIKDFVASKNPKFAGKSKEKRKEMALAAYYAKQRNEEVELDEVSKKTLGSYIKKASSDMARQREKRVDTSNTRTDQDKAHNKEFNRKFGIRTAVDKLTREETGLDETYKKGDYVKHGKTGAVGQVQNVSSDKSSVDVKWNKKGYITSHDSSDVKPMKEDLAIPLLGGDGDESAEMLKTQLKAIANKAMHLVTQLSDDQLIEPWVQSKIAVAKEQVSAVHDYMVYGDHDQDDTEKEQTGPDTPMTFPGMNVDVNTGRNV